jgi:Methyltransferase domain
MNRCIACGNHIVRPLYSPGLQPLMALNLPRSYDEAKGASSYPMNFYICCFCGHVYNADFDYAKIPYAEDSHRMYNQGYGWIAHSEFLVNKLHKNYYPQGKTIIDIGAGDGEFLGRLKQKFSISRCIAFEPGIESEACCARHLETYADYFVPQRDMRKFKPDIITCKHVLEHLQEPRDFVADISYHANIYNVYPIFVAEVPCITKALETYRITDFLYEHVSNFTQRSLRVMFESTGWATLDEFLSYGDEVAVWIGRPTPLNLQFEQQAKDFSEHDRETATSIHDALEVWREAHLTIAFFGGTGKSAAFLNAYHLDSDRVVDSDINKVGRHVPGTGQRIEHVDSLLVKPADVIVITTRWRAADICAEINRKEIKYTTLLVLEDGCLCEYTEGMK